MQVRYLGTGAAEGYPALFCSCSNCRYARTNGGKDLRKRTSALIDGELLIDVGPDLMAAAFAYQLELDKVRWVLQTHSHSDHLLESNFMCREDGFLGTQPAWWDMFGSERSLAPVAAQEAFKQRKVTLHPVKDFETFSVGPYTVTALRARHDMTIDPLFYVIRKAGKTLLWANDTGPFWPETWQALDALAQKGEVFNAACIEATTGTHDAVAPEIGGHMSIKTCGETHKELRRRGLLTEASQCYAHHFSHHATPPHYELTALLAPYRVLPAYDGLLLTL
jgi:phosphoribosyl 1,2-cyclic phosphate phosphodiesterase